MTSRQYRNVLLPNGDVTLCCTDFERRHVLGNLLRDEYADLFEGPV
ncbi:SPASM domain-containing protein [Mesorhizobium sp. M0862]